MMTIDKAFAGQRIDNFLFTAFKGVPKSRIYKGLRKGEFRVNRARISAHYRLSAGDQLRIPPLRVAEPQGADHPPERLLAFLESRLLYEDREVLVINKPSGIPVHGGVGTSWGLIELMHRLRPQKWPLKLIHRLDRETSGCLLIAKKRASLLAWHELLVNRRVKKQYHLLVKGKWPEEVCQVNRPLRKNILRSGERMVTVDPEGKEAITRFYREQTLSKASLLKADLVTGRTHQIRVHALSEGHPIAGDDKYGDAVFNRQMSQLGLRRLFLHCSQLGEFASDLDPDLVAVIKRAKV